MSPSACTQVALFNPIIAHYRAGLVRAMRTSERCRYSLFADPIDKFASIPALDLTGDSLFVATRSVRYWRFTWQYGALRAAFQSFDVYILLGNPAWLSSWAIALLARLRGKRVLLWTHGWTRRDGIAKRLVRHAMYRLAHGLLLYGERARQIGMGYGFRAESLYVVYNSLDFERQRSLSTAVPRDAGHKMRNHYFGDENTPVVIATARLTRAKRFDLLIHALALLAKRGRRVHLLIVGDGPERDSLAALAADNKVHAALVGACYDEAQLAQFFASANVTVSPGNVGLTCMHSLGYGVPVITHDDPSNQGPEWEAIVPGVNGAFFKKENVEELAAAIAAWTSSSSVDSSTRARCIESICARYHPSRQHHLIETAVLGKSASVANTALGEPVEADRV